VCMRVYLHSCAGVCVCMQECLCSSISLYVCRCVRVWSGHAKCDSAMCAFVNTTQADGTRGSARAGGTEVEAGIGYSGSRRRRSGGTVLEDEEVLSGKGEGRCDMKGGSEGDEGTGTHGGRDLESEVRRKAERMRESTHTHESVSH
jgi:hypothetical protein